MQHRLTVAAVAGWLAATAAAVAFVVPLFPRHAIMAAFSTPFPFEARPTPDQFGVVHLASVPAGIVAGVLIGIGAPALHRRLVRDEADRRRFRTAARWTGLVAASGTPVLPLLLIVLPNPSGFALALPAAVLSGWMLHRLQRHRRLPVAVSLAAFGWGATFAMTVGILLQQLHTVAVLTSYTGLLAEPLVLELAAPLWEEFAKAAGVLLIFGLVRSRYPGLVHGVVIGALVGAGFNFVETVRFAHTTFDIAMHHIWIRQWVGGFFFAHVLFTATFAASVAMAGPTRNHAVRLLLPFAGFGVAVAAHLGWNHLAMVTGLPWQTADPTLAAFVMYPLNYLTVSGPLLVALVVLVWHSIRREGAALRAVLQVEARTGYDAITPDEAALLGDPRRRVGSRLLAIRTLGPGGYVGTGRLQAAQLDLAAERWRLAHAIDCVSPGHETELRGRVLVLKAELAVAGRRP